MDVAKAVNLALALALEFAMLAALGYWAFGLAHGGWMGAVAAAIAIAAAIALWAIWGAPKSARRLKMPGLLLFKIVIFGLAVTCLWVAGQPVWAVALALLTALNLALAGLWGQQ
jgi:hypothetical protein